MTTDERLEKVEGQLARVRWFNHFLMVSLVLSLSLWGLTQTFGPETAWAKYGPKEIRANSFVVEGENGKSHAVLAQVKDGSFFSLCDENGKSRVALSGDKDGSFLLMRDERGKIRARLSVVKGAPALRLYDANGNPIWSAP